jgi:hypothetical protein
MGQIAAEGIPEVETESTNKNEARTYSAIEVDWFCFRSTEKWSSARTANVRAKEESNDGGAESRGPRAIVIGRS